MTGFGLWLAPGLESDGEGEGGFGELCESLGPGKSDVISEDIGPIGLTLAEALTPGGVDSGPDGDAGFETSGVD